MTIARVVSGLQVLGVGKEQVQDRRSMEAVVGGVGLL